MVKYEYEEEGKSVEIEHQDNFIALKAFLEELLHLGLMGEDRVKENYSVFCSVIEGEKEPEMEEPEPAPERRFAGLSWLQASEKLLRLKQHPMTYKKIAKELLDQGFKTDSEYPANNVSTLLSTDIREHPDETPFIRTAPGQYFLKEFIEEEPETEEIEEEPEPEEPEPEYDFEVETEKTARRDKMFKFSPVEDEIVLNLIKQKAKSGSYLTFKQDADLLGLGEKEEPDDEWWNCLSEIAKKAKKELSFVKDVVYDSSSAGLIFIT